MGISHLIIANPCIPQFTPRTQIVINMLSLSSTYILPISVQSSLSRIRLYMQHMYHQTLHPISEYLHFEWWTIPVGNAVRVNPIVVLLTRCVLPRSSNSSVSSIVQPRANSTPNLVQVHKPHAITVHSTTTCPQTPYRPSNVRRRPP